MLAGEMNAQIGQLHSSETHLGGLFSVDAQRTDSVDRLLQLCNEHQHQLSTQTLAPCDLEAALHQSVMDSVGTDSIHFPLESIHSRLPIFLVHITGF